MTYRECYEEGRTELKRAGVPEAALDARLLLEYVCSTDRNTLLAHGDRGVTDGEQTRYRVLVAERAGRVPLQHLTGTQEFMGMEFRVNEHVLIPRQETEILVEEVMRHLHDGMRILDMCTGSGCILISLIHYSNRCSGVGVDLSEAALEVAWDNAKRLLQTRGEQFEAVKETEPKVDTETETVIFQKSNLFENVEGQFEIIVSNPPYIESEVIGTLMPEVRLHEPVMALDGGEDGLDFYRQIVRDSQEHLSGGGMLFFEIGYNQGEAVKTLLEQNSFIGVEIVQDYAGLDRVVYGTRL